MFNAHSAHVATVSISRFHWREIQFDRRTNLSYGWIFKCHTFCLAWTPNTPATPNSDDLTTTTAISNAPAISLCTKNAERIIIGRSIDYTIFFVDEPLWRWMKLSPVFIDDHQRLSTLFDCLALSMFCTHTHNRHTHSTNILALLFKWSSFNQWTKKKQKTNLASESGDGLVSLWCADADVKLANNTKTKATFSFLFFRHGIRIHNVRSWEYWISFFKWIEIRKKKEIQLYIECHDHLLK